MGKRYNRSRFNNVIRIKQHLWWSSIYTMIIHRAYWHTNSPYIVCTPGQSVPVFLLLSYLHVRNREFDRSFFSIYRIVKKGAIGDVKHENKNKLFYTHNRSSFGALNIRRLHSINSINNIETLIKMINFQKGI